MASVTKPAGVYIIPESFRVNVLMNGAAVLKVVMGLGSDGLVYEQDWTTGTWKSFQQ